MFTLGLEKWAHKTHWGRLVQRLKRCKRLLKPFASIRLAITILSLLAIFVAVGTVVESKYDATAAQKLVYHTWFFRGVLVFLAINLTAVLIDRIPWRRRHTGFICAHIGIIMLLLGAFLTQNYGIDGHVAISIGQSSNEVILPDHQLIAYISKDGFEYQRIWQQDADFFLNPPTSRVPQKIPTEIGEILVTDYMAYALPEEKVVLSQSQHDGPAIRFQLENDFVNVTHWLSVSPYDRVGTLDLGPAQVILAEKPPPPDVNRNSIVFESNGTEKLSYRIYKKNQKKVHKSGFLKATESFSPGWMNMKFRLLKFFPHARNEVTYSLYDYPTPLTTSAIRVQFGEHARWLGSDRIVKFFKDNAVVVIRYTNKKIKLGFNLHLKEFNVGRYQGTLKAASYESHIDVDRLGPVVISMNEPLQYQGLTFYQASFEEDPNGQPLASILSVNYDPGRYIKYAGSLLIVLGVIMMFYFKQMIWRRSTDESNIHGNSREHP